MSADARSHTSGALSVLMGVPKPGIPGGPQGHLPFLVQELRDLGVSVHEEMYGNPYGRITAWRRASLVLTTAQRLRAAQARARFDVVHLNTAFDTNALLRDVTVTALLRRDGSRLFLKFHGGHEELARPANPVLRSLVNRLMARADAVGVLSTQQRQHLLDAGFHPERVFLVKNILRPERYAADPGFRRGEGLPEDVPLVLFAARFVREKGSREVVEAASILRSQGERCLFVLAGDGPVKAEAEADARRLGLGEMVRFTGQIPEEQMRRFYANVTLLAFPTYDQEGFPMVLFQSVAAGLPVVTTRIRAAADYLREPDNCLWVEPRNAAQLAEKIRYLLQNPDLCRRMGECNRKLAGQFTARTVTEEYLQIYDRLLTRTNHDR